MSPGAFQIPCQCFGSLEEGPWSSCMLYSISHEARLTSLGQTGHDLQLSQGYTWGSQGGTDEWLGQRMCFLALSPVTVCLHSMQGQYLRSLTYSVVEPVRRPASLWGAGMPGSACSLLPA